MPTPIVPGADDRGHGVATPSPAPEPRPMPPEASMNTPPRSLVLTRTLVDRRAAASPGSRRARRPPRRPPSLAPDSFRPATGCCRDAASPGHVSGYTAVSRSSTRWRQRASTFPERWAVGRRSTARIGVTRRRCGENPANVPSPRPLRRGRSTPKPDVNWYTNHWYASRMWQPPRRKPLGQRIRDAGGFYRWFNAALIRIAGPADVGVRPLPLCRNCNTNVRAHRGTGVNLQCPDEP